MKEFLLDNYSLLTKSVEILAAVTGLILWKKYSRSAAKFFIWFLVYVAAIELIGGYTKYLHYFDLYAHIEHYWISRTYWWYTITWYLVSPIFYQFFFRKKINSVRFKRFLLTITVIYAVVFIGYYTIKFKLLFSPILPFLQLFGLAIIFFSVLFYFMEILNSDRILKIGTSIYFYIGAIVLIWFFVITPLVFYEPYFMETDPSYVDLRNLITLIANFLMYLSFTFALIWCKPESK